MQKNTGEVSGSVCRTREEVTEGSGFTQLPLLLLSAVISMEILTDNFHEEICHCFLCQGERGAKFLAMAMPATKDVAMDVVAMEGAAKKVVDVAEGRQDIQRGEGCVDTAHGCV